MWRPTGKSPPDQPLAHEDRHEDLLYWLSPFASRRFGDFVIFALVQVLGRASRKHQLQWPLQSSNQPKCSRVRQRRTVRRSDLFPVRYRSKSCPKFHAWRQNSIHGVVKVRVQVNVNEAGEVTLAGLAAHGPSRYFARQALDAARQWSFTAPVVDGKTVASRWVIEFDFRRSGVKTESKMVQAKA